MSVKIYEKDVNGLKSKNILSLTIEKILMIFIWFFNRTVTNFRKENNNNLIHSMVRKCNSYDSKDGIPRFFKKPFVIVTDFEDGFILEIYVFQRNN